MAADRRGSTGRNGENVSRPAETVEQDRQNDADHDPVGEQQAYAEPVFGAIDPAGEAEKQGQNNPSKYPLAFAASRNVKDWSAARQRQASPDLQRELYAGVCG